MLVMIPDVRELICIDLHEEYVTKLIVVRGNPLNDEVTLQASVGMC